MLTFIVVFSKYMNKVKSQVDTLALKFYLSKIYLKNPNKFL